MDQNKELRLHFFSVAIQAIIQREGALCTLKKEQVAKEALDYAEKAIKAWEQKMYEQTLL
jgi:hypothetical protein